MTILFFSRLFYPHIGGVEKHVYEISKILLKKGHKVTVVTEELPTTNIQVYQYRGKTAKSREVWEGIKIYRIPVGKNNWFKKLRIWFWFFKHINLIKDADVVHCHDVFFWYLPFRFLFPFKKVYTTFHGYEGEFPPSKKAILIRKISEKLSWGNISIGHFIKKWYKTNPTYVSYGAVVLPDMKNSQNIKKESAIFIGRLDEQTGILEYVKALEILKKKYPKFELLVVGNGKYKSLIDKKVKTIGFQKNPEKYFQNYHFAFVSGYLSILESMAARRPVVAIYGDSLKEDYLKMTPYAKFMIIEKTPGKIAEAVEELLQNPKIENKMVEAAYDWVKTQTWDKVTELYVKLWGENL